MKKKQKDPAISDEDSDDDEQEIADLLKDDGQFTMPRENQGIVRLDLKRFD